MATAATGTASARVKVVGERNTGSNLLASLIQTHTNATVVSSTAPALIARWARRTKTRFPTEVWFRLTEQRNGGWKHAHPDRIAEAMGRGSLRSVSVAIMMRDPWSWLASTYRRPYHWGIADYDSFASFLQSPMPALRREFSGAHPPMTPVETWNAKAQGAIRLLGSPGGAATVRYEDLITQCDATIMSLCESLQLQKLSFAELPSFGLKPGDSEVPADHYVERVRTAAHLGDYDAEAKKVVAETLDPDTVQHFGYSCEFDEGFERRSDDK